jgi:hypothetical protein
VPPHSASQRPAARRPGGAPRAAAGPAQGSIGARRGSSRWLELVDGMMDGRERVGPGGLSGGSSAAPPLRTLTLPYMWRCSSPVSSPHSTSNCGQTPMSDLQQARVGSCVSVSKHKQHKGLRSSGAQRAPTGCGPCLRGRSGSRRTPARHLRWEAAPAGGWAGAQDEHAAKHTPHLPRPVSRPCAGPPAKCKPRHTHTHTHMLRP